MIAEVLNWIIFFDFFHVLLNKHFDIQKNCGVVNFKLFVTLLIFNQFEIFSFLLMQGQG